MKRLKKSLKIIYKCILTNEKTFIDNEEEFEFIYKIANKSHLTNILYHALEISDRLQKKYPEETKKIKDVCLLCGIKSALQTKTFNSIVEEYKKEDIKLTVIKGYIIRDYYYSRDMRIMGDIDFIVPNEKYTLAKKILLNKMSYSKIDEDYLELIAISPQNIVVELHNRLVSNTSLNIDFFESNYQKNMVDLGEYLSLNTDFHFLYIMDHTRKHFVNGGIGLKYIFDFALFMNKFPNIVERNLSQIYSLKLEKIIYAFLKICNKYLSEDFSYIMSQMNVNISDESIEEMVNMMATYGEYGTIHSRMNAKEVHGTYCKRLLKRMFPPFKRIYKNDHNNITNYFCYPFILPIYWIKTLFLNRKIINKIFFRKKNLSEIEKLKKMYSEIN